MLQFRRNLMQGAQATQMSKAKSKIKKVSEFMQELTRKCKNSNYTKMRPLQLHIRLSL